MNNATELVGLYNTKGSEIKMHAAACPMVATVGRKVVKVTLDEARAAETEQGYKVTFCKCCKR